MPPPQNGQSAAPLLPVRRSKDYERSWNGGSIAIFSFDPSELAGIFAEHCGRLAAGSAKQARSTHHSPDPCPAARTQPTHRSITHCSCCAVIYYNKGFFKENWNDARGWEYWWAAAAVWASEACLPPSIVRALKLVCSADTQLGGATRRTLSLLQGRLQLSGDCCPRVWPLDLARLAAGQPPQLRADRQPVLVLHPQGDLHHLAGGRRR